MNSSSFYTLRKCPSLLEIPKILPEFLLPEWSEYNNNNNKKNNNNINNNKNNNNNHQQNWNEEK